LARENPISFYVGLLLFSCQASDDDSGPNEICDLDLEFGARLSFYFISLNTKTVHTWLLITPAVAIGVAVSYLIEHKKAHEKKRRKLLD